jgi:putrescine transport system substrate-binding protein
MSKKLRSITGLAVLAALLAACGSKPAETPKTDSGSPAIETDAEKIVNVYNWSDYIEPTVIEAFEKDTGLKVNYEVMDSNELLETKLLAGRTGYDVVVPSASFLARQIKANIYQKLDKSKLPNLKNRMRTSASGSRFSIRATSTP